MDNITISRSFTQCVMLREGDIGTEEKMSIAEQRKHLRTMKGRYEQAENKSKSKRQLLDETQAVTGKHREKAWSS